MFNLDPDLDFLSIPDTRIKVSQRHRIPDQQHWKFHDIRVGGFHWRNGGFSWRLVVFHKYIELFHPKFFKQ
jgi:hypothetical protein